MKTNINTWLQFIKPVLDGCSHLVHMKVKGIEAFPEIILSALPSRHKLATLRIDLDTDDFGTFQYLIAGAKTTPYLCRISIAESSRNTKLTFDQCRQLAKLCGALDIVKLAREDENSEFDLWSTSATAEDREQMCLDSKLDGKNILSEILGR